MRLGVVLGRIFYVVTEINHRIIGSSEFRRNLDGFFGGLPTARNLGGNLC